MSNYTVHPSAIVDDGAVIGEGSRVWHWVHISGGARIGKACSLGQNVYVGNRVVIGDNVKIQNNVSVYDNVTLEDGVFCGPSMVFTNVYNPRAEVSRKDEYRDTLVKRGATLGANCTIVCGTTIGEYAFVGAGVTLGAGTRLHHHASVEGHTVLGAGCEVFPYACLGGKTQDLKFKGGITHVRIGDHNVFREYCTVHAATADGKATVVGSHNHFLAYTHLAHDVQVGNHVIMSNVATLAGHVTVEDHVVIGGLAAVHQFCRIGRHAMVGGCSKVVQDVAPFMMADGNPAETRYINKVGLERAGFPPETIAALAKAYKTLFRAGLTLEAALARLEEDRAVQPESGELVAFIRASQRGIAR